MLLVVSYRSERRPSQSLVGLASPQWRLRLAAAPRAHLRAHERRATRGRLQQQMVRGRNVRTTKISTADITQPLKSPIL